MFRCIYLVISLFISQHLYGQLNLVPNPSFEDTLQHNGFCYGPVDWATNWFNPTNNTPDLYTFSPGSINCTTSSLNNPSGYQIPHSGSTYVGIYTYAGFTREYVANKLDSNLSIGCSYYIEFYVSLANNFGLATDKIGMALVDDTTGFSNLISNIPINPAIQSLPGLLLTDTLNWMKVSGNYVANGNERYLIIGNFYDDSNTLVDTAHAAMFYSAYYYIDDVKILACNTGTSLQNDLNLENLITFYPNPVDSKLQIKTHESIKLFQISLFDISGRLMLFQSFPELDVKYIDFENYKHGFYMLKILLDNNQILTTKIIH